MRRKKRSSAPVVVLAVVAFLLLAMVVTMLTFTFAEGKLYPKFLKELDLREQTVTAELFEKLQAQMPKTRIHWNVPFQGASYPDDIRELTLSALAPEELELLRYFPELETVRAVNFQDITGLLQGEQLRPDINWDYTPVLGGEAIDRNATALTLSGMEPGEVMWLKALPKLESVTVTGTYCEAYAGLLAHCQDNGVSLSVVVDGETLPDTTTALTLEGSSDEDLSLLRLLPRLRKLHLVEPAAEAKNVTVLPEQLPNTKVTWEVDINGKLFDSDDVEVDLSGMKVADLAQIEANMQYLPAVEKLIIEDMSLDNEVLAAYRERARADYKVVWTVWCGDQLTKYGKPFTTRTDAVSFMPYRDGLQYFRDFEAVNLKYCEDIIAMDIGHMTVRDISFVEYMPNLKYLILAHSDVRSLEPLRKCKNLVFLEVDWSAAPDFSPLVDCTALEDLNIGNTKPDVTPILQMTWLKNLWCNKRPSVAKILHEGMPDTCHVQTDGTVTVGNGWRELPNYYAMRDLLEMPYM